MTDYRSRVVWEDEDLLVLDKPPGCPCALHASNALEALDVAASASLGIPLIRLNRLDSVTSGLVTVAKTAKGATMFWEELRRDRVGKKYKALVAPGPVPLGVLEHYMPGKIIHRRPAPRAISRQPLDGWKVCQTRVLSSTPISLPGLEDTAGTGTHSFHEVEAELITGRTHQLRAVFAAEGSPIVHDTMYAPLKSFLLENEDHPAIQSIYPLCVEPRASEGIALQCAALTFLGKTIEAGDPWWRTVKSSSPTSSPSIHK
jgi:23S rRNA-/tRNA-specific pseudouridylate synthase